MAERVSDALVSAITVSAAVPAAADTGLALNVPGCADLLASRAFGDLEVEQVQDVLAPRDAGAGQSAGDDLGEAREVGPHVERHLRAALGGAEAGDDLVEDQDGAVLRGILRSSCANSASSGTWPNDEPVGS